MRTVSALKDAALGTFQQAAHAKAVPCRLPQGIFKQGQDQQHVITAITKWFHFDIKSKACALDASSLTRYGDFNVPIEVTHTSGQFDCLEVPFSQFIAMVKQPQKDLSIYLAQCSLSALPEGLRADIKAPVFVEQSGKGDVYDSSIWLGQAPTYTPLHKDPNPNLFVQLRGAKQIRLFPPEIGLAIFQEAQRLLGSSASASFRGNEMMQGEEKTLLEDMVWGKKAEVIETHGLEADLDAGDGLFIPQGWWHSLKGVGGGINGSVRSQSDNHGALTDISLQVNWWFR